MFVGVGNRARSGSASHRATAWNRAWNDDASGGGVEMSNNAYMVIYFVVMVVCIVGADFLFLRDRFLARLIANIAIVAAFAAVYFLFLRSL